MGAGFVGRPGLRREVWEVGSKPRVKHSAPQVTGSVLAPGAALGLQAIAFRDLCDPEGWVTALHIA